MFSFVDDCFDFAHKVDKPYSPSEEYFRHIHVYNEILYLVHGDMEFTVESETRHLNDGDLVFIRSGKYHFATVNTKVEYERYVLKFPDKFVPKYVKAKLDAGYSFFNNCKKYEVIFNMFDKYLQQYNDEELHVIFAADLIKMMTMLCHEYTQKTGKQIEFITKIIEFIEANISKNITIQMLTDEFHYSTSFIF